MTRIVVRNAKRAAQLEKQAIATAADLLTKYPAERVCLSIWNRFGFLTDVTKRGTLAIGTFAELPIPERTSP